MNIRGLFGKSPASDAWFSHGRAGGFRSALTNFGRQFVGAVCQNRLRWWGAGGEGKGLETRRKTGVWPEVFLPTLLSASCFSKVF